MNIDLESAIRLAQEFLYGENLTRFGYVPTVDARKARVVEGGYVVPWTTEAYLVSGNIEDNVAGNAPICVEGEAGSSRYFTDDDYAKLRAAP